jgi:trehalose-6-phosphate synthase
VGAARLSAGYDVEEFEDAINEAIEGNTERANEQFSKMADEFLAQFAQAPYTAMAQHPVADRLSDALSKPSAKRR